MNATAFRFSALLAIPLFLAACGGGDSAPGLTQDEIEELQSDPRIVRLEGILERADTLLIPSMHLDYSLTVAGQTQRETEVVAVSCTGSSCDIEGDMVVADDAADPEVGIDLTQVDLGSRAGFDTGSYAGRFVPSEAIPDATLTTEPAVLGYGFWGEYGFAQVNIVDAPISGEIFGVDFDGYLRMAIAYVAGEATGANPTGMGSATWTGIAEAVSTGDYRRREGTSTVTIPDLSRPSVTVAVEVDGNDIGSSAWSDMSLTNGHFTAGTVGADFLAGNFHGPAHEETYGAFDTVDYVGVFGAKREP